MVVVVWVGRGGEEVYVCVLWGLGGCVWGGETLIRNDENQINSGSPILLRAQHFER